MKTLKNIFEILFSVMGVIGAHATFHDNTEGGQGEGGSESDNGMPAAFQGMESMLLDQPEDLNKKPEPAAAEKGEGDKKDEKQETEEEKAARLANETPEEKAAREAKEKEADVTKEGVKERTSFRNEGEKPGEKKDEEKPGGKEETAEEKAAREAKEAGGEAEIKIYKYKDKEIAEKDLNIIKEKMTADLGAEFIAALPDKQFETLFEKYINLGEGSKALAERNQQAARTKEALDAERAELDADKKKLEDGQKDLQEKIDKNNDLLTKIQKEKEAAEKQAAAEPTPEILDDDEKLMDFKLDKKDAKKKVESLTETEKRLKELLQKQTEIAGKNTEEDERIHHLMILNSIEQTIPELQISRNPLDVFEQAQNVPIPKDETAKLTEAAKQALRDDNKELEEDIEKMTDDEKAQREEEQVIATRVAYLFNAYRGMKETNPDSKQTVAQFYNIMKKNLPELKRSTPQRVKKTIAELRAEGLRKYFKEQQETQKQTPPALPGGGGGEGHSTERNVQGTEQSEKDYWKSLGYEGVNDLLP